MTSTPVRLLVSRFNKKACVFDDEEGEEYLPVPREDYDVDESRLELEIAALTGRSQELLDIEHDSIDEADEMTVHLRLGLVNLVERSTTLTNAQAACLLWRKRWSVERVRAWVRQGRHEAQEVSKPLARKSWTHPPAQTLPPCTGAASYVKNTSPLLLKKLKCVVHG